MFIILFTIALIMLGAMALKIFENVLSSPKRAKELNGNYEPCENSDEPLACDALVTRVFEQRLVDAGIMTVADMTVCDSPKCKDCLPTHQAKSDAVRVHRPPRPKPRNSLPPPPKSLSTGKAGMNRYAKQGEQRLRLKSKTGEYLEIPWPDEVPTYANFSLEYDASMLQDYVAFKWIDKNTGQTMGRKMILPSFGEVPVAVYSDQNEKPIHSPMTPERRKAAVKNLTRGWPTESVDGTHPL